MLQFRHLLRHYHTANARFTVGFRKTDDPISKQVANRSDPIRSSDLQHGNTKMYAVNLRNDEVKTAYHAMQACKIWSSNHTLGYQICITREAIYPFSAHSNVAITSTKNGILFLQGNNKNCYFAADTWRSFESAARVSSISKSLDRFELRLG